VSYEHKLAALQARLAGLPGAVVAFSGGVDSAMLLHACREALGERVLAVTADSPSFPRAELDEAVAFAKRYGIRHEVVRTQELERDAYKKNDRERCYHCKTELFATIGGLQQAWEAAAAWPVLFGAIADDLQDDRPGARAAREHGVHAPLQETGWSKEDVRRYSREHGLSTAEKPAFACLSSRIPHGTPVDATTLARIEAAEAVLRRLCYRQFRVRHHGQIARVELEPDELARAIGEDREPILRGIQAAGYAFVALDLAGYRTGALHAATVSAAPGSATTGPASPNGEARRT
jgi:uncharacterized protein